SVLREMLETTYPAQRSKAKVIGAVRHMTYQSGSRGWVKELTVQKQEARRMLFPDSSEALASMILLGCLRGLNLSQITNLPLPDRTIDSAGVLAQVGTDKPRRGPSRRFDVEV